LLLFHFGVRRLDAAFLFFVFGYFNKAVTSHRTPNHFTGSCPPAQNGWHRSKRQIAIPLPRTAPCRSIASRAYSEQVGTKRQDGGNQGEITAL